VKHDGHREGFTAALDVAGLDLNSRLRILPPDRRYPLQGIVKLETRGPGEHFLYHDRSGPSWDGEGKDSLQGCLSSFVRLHTAANHPERILHFAREYGTLGFCEHIDRKARYKGYAGTPANTCPLCAAVRKTHLKSVLRCEGQEAFNKHKFSPGWCETCCALQPREPIDSWILTVRQVRAALSITASLRSGCNIAPIDWDNLFLGPIDRAITASWQRDIDERRVVGCLQAWSFVTDITHNWLQMDTGNPLVFSTRWDKDNGGRFEVRIGASGLLANLALQLAALLSATDRTHVCDACGDPIFDRQRRPRHGIHVLCSDCKLASDAERQRARYAQQNPQPRRNSKYRTG